jgi:hypothetical protein
VRLSVPAGRLRRMFLLAAGAVWVAAATAAGVLIGRAIRHADHQQRRVPQLDVPLWRGTDLDGPPCPRS